MKIITFLKYELTVLRPFCNMNYYFNNKYNLIISILHRLNLLNIIVLDFIK